ncbi:MAG: CpaF family protein [Ardenticatenaceae bacterium]|nr:CpaF family protein [Anaerolineales bacterium]MCB8923442.1 CpaF family protein [Ardenticatenaceae bacterium]MCB8991403.1 CpaF family protein [Ardenticatenaceae bacterium]MCB9003833.1 CpaF family protein [Ardenticatenaceae bacterium]
MSLLKRIERNQVSTRSEPSKLQELRVKRASPTTGSRDAYVELKNRIQQRLIAELDPSMDITQSNEVRSTIQEMFEAMLAEESIVLTRNEKRRLFEAIVAEILGYGPLEQFLNTEGVTEIMVNGPKSVYIERAGKLQKVNVQFEDDDHLMRIIDRIVAPLGRRIDEGSPMVDARLPDGSRVNAVVPPIALNGPTLTIRLFSKVPLTVENLIEFGSITPEAVEFLKACVIAKLNVFISGGTGSGKTTLLNILSGFIPDGERIVTIENAAELQLRQDHVVTLESRSANVEGRGEVTIQDLVVNSLRMRPDRIIVGEVRGGEALDMLQAMNTGHDGSLATGHANSTRDMLARLETMVLMAGMDLPHRAIREQIASAIHLVVHQDRMRDGTRKIMSISEIQGMEGDVITASEIFRYEQTGFENGKVIGRLRPTGLRPKFMWKIQDAGIMLPPSVFGIGSRSTRR